jgi:hypothetical protein
MSNLLTNAVAKHPSNIKCRIKTHDIVHYLQLIESHLLGETVSEEDDDRLAKIFYKKLPRNTGMAKVYVASTRAELDGGLDTVEKACLRVKKLLAVVRQAIRLASSTDLRNTFFVLRVRLRNSLLLLLLITTINVVRQTMQQTSKMMSPPRHKQWSLTANVAEDGDTTNHFANRVFAFFRFCKNEFYNSFSRYFVF